MTYSLITSATAIGGSSTTAAVNTTGADLIVACTAAYGASGSVTDSKGNTWTRIGSLLVSGAVTLGCYYCQAPTVGSGHTFSTTAGYSTFFVAAFSGSVATPLDQTISASGASVTTLSSGSVTPAQGNELVVAFLGVDGGTANPTIGSSYNLVASAYNGGPVEGGGLAYIIQGGASATNPAWSWPGACSGSALIASFKTATVAPTRQPMLVRFGSLSLRDALMAGAAAAIVKNPSLSRRGLFGRLSKLGLRSN